MAALDAVFVAEDVTGDLQILAAGDVDGPTRMQWGQLRLLHRRDLCPVRRFDVHRVAPGQRALTDLQQFLAAGVLEHQRLAEPEGLLVDLVRTFAVVVGDPIVVADREQLLSHPVPHRACGGQVARLVTAHSGLPVSSDDAGGATGGRESGPPTGTACGAAWGQPSPTTGEQAGEL